MNLDAYLRRIGIDRPAAPTLAALRAVTTAHAHALPFENVGVLVSGAPDLAPQAIEDKLVHRRRGGYCYEQNALLAAALGALGFAVTPLAARVRHGIPAEVVTPRSHMLLVVDLPEGRFLADAGFGGLTPTAPIRIDQPLPQATPHEDFRAAPFDGAVLLQARVGGSWRDVYQFDFARMLPADFVQQNWHTATRPGALFANNLIVTRPQPGARWTLFNRLLRRRTPAGDEQLATVDSRAMLDDVLRGRFDLALPEDDLAVAWEVSGRGQPPHPGFS